MIKFSMLKLLLLVSCLVGTFCSKEFETRFKELQCQREKSCFLSKEILSFYEKATEKDQHKAKIALLQMAKQIFKEEKNKKTSIIRMCKIKIF